MQHARSDGSGDGQDGGRGEQQFSAEIEFAREVLGHNAGDAFLEVGAGDAGDARERGADTELANLQDAFGIDLTVIAGFEDGFVAGAFAFIE